MREFRKGLSKKLENSIPWLIHWGKRGIQSAVIIIEVLPITNEGIRYGALAATEVVTRSPLVGAMVFGGLTLLIEGTAALATSEFITGNVSNKMFDWFNEKVGKLIPQKAKMSRSVEAGLALYLGTPHHHGCEISGKP